MSVHAAHDAQYENVFDIILKMSKKPECISTTQALNSTCDRPPAWFNGKDVTVGPHQLGFIGQSLLVVMVVYGKSAIAIKSMDFTYILSDGRMGIGNSRWVSHPFGNAHSFNTGEITLLLRMIPEGASAEHIYDVVNTIYAIRKPDIERVALATASMQTMEERCDASNKSCDLLTKQMQQLTAENELLREKVYRAGASDGAIDDLRFRLGKEKDDHDKTLAELLSARNDYDELLARMQSHKTEADRLREERTELNAQIIFHKETASYCRRQLKLINLPKELGACNCGINVAIQKIAKEKMRSELLERKEKAVEYNQTIADQKQQISDLCERVRACESDFIKYRSGGAPSDYAKRRRLSTNDD